MRQVGHSVNKMETLFHERRAYVPKEQIVIDLLESPLAQGHDEAFFAFNDDSKRAIEEEKLKALQQQQQQATENGATLDGSSNSRLNLSGPANGRRSRSNTIGTRSPLANSRKQSVVATSNSTSTSSVPSKAQLEALSSASEMESHLKVRSNEPNAAMLRVCRTI